MVVLGGPLNALGKIKAFDDLELTLHRHTELSAVPALPLIQACGL